jgi:phenylacetate-CoA ligase
MSSLLKLYHALPAPLRSLAASLRGYYLSAWRYGPETDRLVAEALAREWWSARQWQTWQQERLRQILQRAAMRVPYYRDYWAKRRRGGDHSSWEQLENWPILDKESLRANPRAFLADDRDPRQLFCVHTSGSSGKPLTLWRSREAGHAWYALFEARWRRWYGVSRLDRWAILGGQLVTPVTSRKPPFWAWNAGLNQLYLSSYHLAPENIPAYLDALRRHRVTYLLGYASALETLAQFASEQGLDVPELRVIVSNAEPLYRHQRERIYSAFQCPVHDTYGMTETVAAASECDAGHLHLWPDAGVLEVFRDDANEPSLAGETGRFICTGLLNVDNPLIRYDVGDRGAVAPAGGRCSCGRTLPMLQQIEGRADDVVLTRDGRRVGRLDPVFKGELKIREAQIIQESLERICVRFVPAPGYTERDGKAVVSGLRERLGDVSVVLEQVAEIPRSANGKFRGVISMVRQEANEVGQTPDEFANRL